MFSSEIICNINYSMFQFIRYLYIKYLLNNDVRIILIKIANYAYLKGDFGRKNALIDLL